MTLRALRESIRQTQGDVARRVSMTQPQLCRTWKDNAMGRRVKLRLIQALGGKIERAAVGRRGHVLDV